MLAKNTPRIPPSTPIGVSMASINGKRSSALRNAVAVADELQVLVAAHLGVAAEVHEVGRVAPALEPAGAQRQQARCAEAQVVARDRCPRSDASSELPIFGATS